MIPSPVTLGVLKSHLDVGALGGSQAESGLCLHWDSDVSESLRVWEAHSAPVGYSGKMSAWRRFVLGFFSGAGKKGDGRSGDVYLPGPLPYLWSLVTPSYPLPAM